MNLSASSAAAGAVINGVKGLTLTELGWDIRVGTHCSPTSGAPRFNIVTSDQGDALHRLSLPPFRFRSILQRPAGSAAGTTLHQPCRQSFRAPR